MRVDFFERRPYMWAFSMLVVGLALSSGFGFWSSGLICHSGSILRLSLLSGWWNLPLIFSRDFLAFSEGLFRPVGYAFLSVVRSFVGPEACGFWHVFLMGFHVINALLVFSLVRVFSGSIQSDRGRIDWSIQSDKKRIDSRTGVALLSGLVFGLHPLASVVFGQAVYFPYLLGLTFLLASLRCYVAYDRSRGRGFYALSVFLFFLSMLTCKAGAGLPLFLLAYEGLYRRRGFRGALIRCFPFAMVLVPLVPFYLYWRPHPLLYTYMEFPEGAGLNSFFSVVGASGTYFKGFLWGGGVPLVLYEVVERIFGVLHWKFLVWGGINLVFVGGAIWVVRKGHWAGLGVLWVFCGMTPFASTAWNGVEAYVSWAYGYVPLVGVAFVIGGLAEVCWKVGRRRVRIGIVVAGCVLVGVYGLRQGVLNGVLRSEVSYWRHVYELAPNERASVALGKAYLDEGDEEQALVFLFSPYVKQLKSPCSAMSRYYSDRGDLVAAAVHLNMSVGEDVGMQFQEYETTRAIWCYKAGALDYAEDALGKITTANPLNAEAAILLSRVWMIKNHIKAARSSLSGVLRIAPFDRGLLRAVEQLEERARKNTVPAVPPPDPSMLRYALQRNREGAVPGEIVRAGARHPEDPVLQMEAGICLIREGKVDSALAKLDFATQRLSSCAHVWATKCWVEAQAGAYEEALATGQRALELDPNNGAVHSVLGFVYEKQVKRPEDLERAVWYYQHSLQLNPRNAAAHNNLGELLIRQGKFEKAAEHFRQALRIRPDYAESHHNLGNILMREGKLKEAILSFEEALRLRPDFVEARGNLGVAFLKEGRIRECEEQFRRVLQVRPDQDKVWENLGSVLIRQSRYREAADLFRRWMRMAPDQPRAILSTAWLLAVCPDADVRDGREAVRLADRVCQAGRYRSPGALGVLAAACAEEGRFEEAVRYAERVLAMAKAGGRDKLMHQIEAQLELYRSDRPYRMRR